MKKRSKQVICGLLAVVLLFSYPLRIKAVFSTAAAYAGYAVLTAGLIAAGIYVRDSGMAESMAQEILDAYNAANDAVIRVQELAAVGVLRGEMLITQAVYSKVKAVVDWAVNNWGLSDNTVDNAVVVVPGQGGSNVPHFSSQPTRDQLYDSGLHLATQNASAGSRYYYIGANSSRVFVCGIQTRRPFFISSVSTDVVYLLWYDNSYKNGSDLCAMLDELFNSSEKIDGNILYYGYMSSGAWGCSYWNDDVPIFASKEEALRAYLGLSPVPAETVDVDTAVVQALPEIDSEYVALQVRDEEGIPLTVPDVVTDAIDDSLAGELSPSVSVSPVVLDGVEIEDGQLIGTPTVVTPADIPLNASDYVLPASISSFFPFCIPFDVWHMVTLLEAEPVAPGMTWEFTLPWDETKTYGITWSLEAWDGVARVCRNLEYLVFLVGLAISTRKFIKW